MTATKYLPAEKLGIRADEHKWLARAAKFLAALQAGQTRKIAGKRFVFDMGTLLCMPSESALPVRECGTVGCIYGAAHLLALAAGKSPWGDDVDFPSGYSEALEPLFFPNRSERWYRKISPARAAAATAGFLTSGKVKFPTAASLAA